MQSSKKAIKFVIYLALAYISWRVLMWFLGEQSVAIEDRIFPAASILWEQLNDFVAEILIFFSSAFLNILGFSTNTAYRSIAILDSSGVAIGNYCLGLEMMYLYTMLILLSPSVSILRKVTFIFFGLLLIQLVNVLRMSALAVLVIKNATWADFNHYVVFRAFVFLLILVLYKYFLKSKQSKSKVIST